MQIHKITSPQEVYLSLIQIFKGRQKYKTGNYPVTGITSYYNARIGIEKELIQSRYSKEISFTVGQKGLLLNLVQLSL